MAEIPVSDKIIVMPNGDVEAFDLEVIDAAIKDVTERKGFYEQYCQPLGSCADCKMGACPIADQA